MPSLSEIPFLDRFRAREAQIRGEGLDELKQVTGVMTLQGLLQKQQEAQALKQVMAQSGGDPAKAIPLLVQAGHIKAASTLSQLFENQQQGLERAQRIAQGQREAAVFSPENIERNRLPGTPAQPEQWTGEAGTPDELYRPAQAAVPGRVDLNALREQAAVTGPKGMETYSAHVANEQNRAAQIAATRQTAKDALMARIYDIDTRSQDRALAREDRIALAEQARELRRELATIVAGGRDTPHAVVGVDASGNQTINFARPSQGPQTFNSRPASTLNAEVRRSTAQEQFIGRQYNAAAKPSRDILGAAETFRATRATGDSAQAAALAAEVLQRAVRSGNARFKAEADKMLGGGYRGGSLPERMGNFVSQLTSGSPTTGTMQTLDKLMDAVEGSAMQQIANQARFFGGQLKDRQSIINALGKPFVQGQWVVTPTGDARKFATPEAAMEAANKWIEEGQ